MNIKKPLPVQVSLESLGQSLHEHGFVCASSPDLDALHLQQLLGLRNCFNRKRV